jgi:hypothetical protein
MTRFDRHHSGSRVIVPRSGLDRCHQASDVFMCSLHLVVALLMLALATTAQAATASAITQLGFRYGHR